jgi:uncharacterized membrane protein YdjX (TVP38/TMEM64 family)
VPRRLRPVLLVALVLLLVWVARALSLTERLTLDGMRTLVHAWEPWGPAIFIAVCVAGLFLHLPEIVFVAVGGLLFGKLYGFVYGWVAVVLGASGTFLVARYFLHDAVQRSIEARFPRLRALDERLAQNGFRTMLVLRVLLFTAPPLNWAVGASRVRFGHYFAGTALGIVPGLTMAVWFADRFAHASANGGGGVADLALPAAVLVGLLVVGAVAARRLSQGPAGGPYPQ